MGFRPWAQSVFTLSQRFAIPRWESYLQDEIIALQVGS
jgi:hypothetical protein